MESNIYTYIYLYYALTRIIGVGAMACSSKDLKKNGPTGPALLPLHILGDKLWELGN
jgi:hypothetical protein